MIKSIARLAAACALLSSISGAGVGPCIIQTVAGAGAVQPGDPTPVDLTNVSGPLSIGPSGNIYFTSMTQVFKLSAGVVYTVGGLPQTTDSTGDGGPAAKAHFTQLSTIMVGPDESLYVSDASRIRKITPEGIIYTIAGTGQPGFSGDGGPATSARVQAVNGLALDSSSQLYFADAGNYRIRKISTAGIISTFAGVGGGRSPSGDDGPATSAQFTQLGNLAIDASGSIYVVDGGRIRSIGTDGVIHAYAGAVQNGGTPLVSGSFGNLASVAVDGSGAVYFIDGVTSYSNVAGKIYRVSAGLATSIAPTQSANLAVDSGGAVYYYASAGLARLLPDGTSVPLQSSSNSYYNPAPADGVPAIYVPLYPEGIATDSSGNLFISDWRTNRIRKVRPDGIISTVAGGATKDGGEGAPALSAKLSPTLLAVNAQGDLFIADYSADFALRIRTVTAVNGLINTVAGGGSANSVGDGGPATAITFQETGGVALDSAGNIYFSDTDRNRVRQVSGGTLQTVAGTDKAVSPARDGYPATQLQIFTPTALAVDSNGILWFLDGYGVRSVGADGILHTVTQMGTGYVYSQPLASGLAVDVQSNLYIAFGRRILRIDSNGYVRTLAGGYKSGFSGDGGPPENAQLTSPSVLSADAFGNLYLIDGQRVREITNLSACAAPAVPELTGTGLDGSVSLETVAPGKRITLTGVNLGPLQNTVAQPDANGYYPTLLAGTRVYVNGTAAPILSAQNTSVTFVVPYAAQAGTLQVEYQGIQSVPAKLAVSPTAPQFFSASGQAGGGAPFNPAYALNEDGTLNSPTNPAAAGSVMAVYLTGEGQTDPPGIDGKIATPPLPKPLDAPSPWISGVPSAYPAMPGVSLSAPAEVTFYGEKPGEIGKLQVNFRVPTGLKAGTVYLQIYLIQATIYIK